MPDCERMSSSASDSESEEEFEVSEIMKKCGSYSYDQENYKCLIELRINKNFAMLMKKLMVSETIRWSRNIYVEHVTGQKQY